MSIELEIIELPQGELDRYARIPIAFEVASIFDVCEGLADNNLLSERVVQPPYVKDYDSLEGASPSSWPSLFSGFDWQMFGAKVNDELIGGALAFIKARDADRVTVLHDLRVSFDARRRGVGKNLFSAVESWAKANGCSALEVETQNINVAACRFYESQRCKLIEVNRGAYPDLPHEIQLLWRKPL